MALKIRMRKVGRTNRPSYRIIVTDSRNPRDGKYLEALGWYNPLEAEEEKNLSVDGERVNHWLNEGAILSEKAAALVERAAPQVMQAFAKKQIERRAKNSLKKKRRKAEV